MRVHSLCGDLFLFLLSLLLLLRFCNGDDKTIFEVVGIGECPDCKDNNFGPSQFFSGLQVTIDCKLKTGEMKRVGAGELDKQGSFKVQLPQHIVQQDGRNLRHECYARLHSSHNGLEEATKIVFKSLNKDKIIFGPTKTLQFFWRHFKCPPFFKPKQLPPPAPIYKPKPKPLPPPAPIYKPKPKPLPPPAPINKPKPKPPVVKPLPPPAPIYKPKPKTKPKPGPKTKPPMVTKPMPPPFPPSPLPPFYKKPCPPLPKLPHFPIFPPKFGYLPPLPPYIPHP